jgi:hypothetical protein
MRNFSRDKSSPKTWATSVIVKNRHRKQFVKKIAKSGHPGSGDVAQWSPKLLREQIILTRIPPFLLKLFCVMNDRWGQCYDHYF